MSYVNEIANHLKVKGSITSWESINQYGNTRLSATIHILRHTYHMNIKSEWYYTRKFWKPWRKTRFVRYVLKKGEYNG